mgnify:FL=1
MWMPMPMGGTSTSEAGEAAGVGGAVGAAGGIGDPLPSSEQEVGGYGQEGGYGQDEGGYAQRGAAEIPEQSGWGDESMEDPWASQSSSEEGGTWSWGDLFPSDE